MQGRTVLVVDDSSDNRVVCGALLEFMGFRVVEATNGDEGVREARQCMPDLIVMDVAMPVMDGIEATRLLKRDPRTAGIPLLILSAHDTAAVRRDAVRAGCDAFLTKPAAPQRVLQELERLLSTDRQGTLSGRT